MPERAKALGKNMHVVKRDGWVETLHLDKITARLKKLSYGRSSYRCDILLVAREVYARVYDGITTSQVDELAAETAAFMACNHPDYASRLYLLKVQGKVVERPQHMLMRVAVGIHLGDIDSAIKTYHLMSKRLFTHASPALLNAGSPRPQLSSCFLTCMKDDSIEGIYDTVKECAVLRKSAGSIGVSVHNIRGTKGISYGIGKMLDVFKATTRFLDQGGGEGGGFTVYLEPWHADISEFLDHLWKSHGKEEHRARDFFYALSVPDLFMERALGDDQWSLFCPNEAPGLADCWGSEFERLYTKYEREGKAKKVVKAQELWNEIVTCQLETGMPYMLFKDSCNRKSNQQNLGTINSSSGLCSGVIQYSSPTETAVCNLASIVLPRFVRDKDVPMDSHPSELAGSLGSKNRYFDFHSLAKVTANVTNDLDRIIDANYYPLESAKTSNMRHRPIGIGVQGLADALQLNTDIFETIYYHALKASSELSARDGAYETYKGSPMSKGILQPDMWNVTPSDRWDWNFLRDMILKNGVRNSLLVSLTGNNKGLEPCASNIINHGGSSGEFTIVNRHLLHDLTNMGLWSQRMKKVFTSENGSIGNIPEIPDDLKAIYRYNNA
uniref:Ribonucleoside-diphosphate reductase n=1 Tax=Brassica oleracea var. oleracea TaxID=109376 RepID=A0A0D3EH37_BRAOL